MSHYQQNIAPVYPRCTIARGEIVITFEMKRLLSTITMSTDPTTVTLISRVSWNNSEKRTIYRLVRMGPANSACGGFMKQTGPSRGGLKKGGVDEVAKRFADRCRRRQRSGCSLGHASSTKLLYRRLGAALQHRRAAPASLRPLANDNSTFQTARYSRSGKANAELRLLFSSGRR